MLAANRRARRPKSGRPGALGVSLPINGRKLFEIWQLRRLESPSTGGTKWH